MRHVIAAVLAVFPPMQLLAQETRFELGRRLRAFEQEWDSVADAEARQRALPHLKQATTSFLSAFLTGQNEEAGRGLDLARLALRTKNPQPERLWAESCAIRLSRRLIDNSPAEINISRFYRPREKQPDGLRCRITLLRDGKSAGTSVVEDVKELPAKLMLPLKGVREDDYTLRCEMLLQDKVLSHREQTLSVCDRLKDRLEKLGKDFGSLKERNSADYFTAKSLLSVLTDLAEGRTLETNYPGARLLHEAETLLQSLAADTHYYGKDRAGQFWLSVAVKERAVPVRVQVPEAARHGKPLPLVIALHGVGGSENMFFDAYGYGAAARLCGQRGWLFVATRGGLTEGLIGELAKLYPIDTKKVFLVGHSMGAGQAIAAASNNPERFAGVAALGGGGTVRPSEAVAKVAFFVGIGKEDFVALRAAQALKSSLERAKIEKIVYKEYDGIEHIVIVQHCLPEVFALFDEIVKR